MDTLGSITRALLVGISLCALLSIYSHAQQAPDLEYQPEIAAPAYANSEGPRIGIDEAHFNFHTAEGRYRPFAALLRRDGYRVAPFTERFTPKSLKQIDILVIANPLHKLNQSNWELPTPSAFTEKEIESLNAWINRGGSLLLIADHMPFPGGADALAQSFGFRFSNGFAQTGTKAIGRPDLFTFDSGLKPSQVTRGRSPTEAISQVATFTGSAFQSPPQATPLIVFAPKAVSLEPRVAWKFNDETQTTDIEGWHQAALLRVGKGRLAVFGEAAMFTAQLAGPEKRRIGMNTVGAEQNHQLLLNTLHWLSGLLE